MDRGYKDIYFKYLDKTPWRGWKPPYDFKRGFMTTQMYMNLVRLLEKMGLKDPLKRILNKKVKKDLVQK